jgi:type I restriction enzyme S subunit
MTKLPETWKSSTIGEVAEIVRGVTYSKSDTLSVTDNDAVPLLRATNLEVDSIDFEDMVYVPKRVVKAQQYLQLDDIFLAASSGSISVVGKSAQVVKTNGETFGAFCAVIRPKNINPKFLAYWVQSPATRDHWSATAKGTNINNLKPSDISETNIPIPPIDEQNKIVELLEDHLSRLDAALADVKQAKVKAAQFRRSYIHEMTTAIEASEVMGILDICDVYQPKTISTKELIPDGEFPVYGANGQIGFYDKFNHEESEVTVTCRGATCGTVNVIPAMSWITGNAMVFRPKDSRLQKGFLEYVLRGMDWTPVITGTAQPQITRTSIQEVFVNVPSPDIQNDIYMKLESSLTQVTNAALLSEKVEMQAASLRRSLLQAAFTGQLTNEVVSV